MDGPKDAVRFSLYELQFKCLAYSSVHPNVHLSHELKKDVVVVVAIFIFIRVILWLIFRSFL